MHTEVTTPLSFDGGVQSEGPLFASYVSNEELNTSNYLLVRLVADLNSSSASTRAASRERFSRWVAQWTPPGAQISFEDSWVNVTLPGVEGLVIGDTVTSFSSLTSALFSYLDINGVSMTRPALEGVVSVSLKLSALSPRALARASAVKEKTFEPLPREAEDTVASSEATPLAPLTVEVETEVERVSPASSDEPSGTSWFWGSFKS